MDRKFMSPQEIIASREKKIANFLNNEVGDKTIYGWQLIVRRHNTATIAKSGYILGLQKMVRKYTGEKNEVLLDSGAIALQAFSEQQRFEMNGITNVYLDCGVALCSREGKTIVGTSLEKALELTPNPLCRKSDVTAIVKSLAHGRNIHNIGDLLCFGKEEIANTSGLGQKRMDMIEKMLKHYHTSFGVLKRPRKVMNGAVVLELQVVAKDKNL